MASFTTCVPGILFVCQCRSYNPFFKMCMKTLFCIIKARSPHVYFIDSALVLIHTV